MKTAKNIEAVQAIYAAWGKGDAPTILSFIADDVDWDYGAAEHDIPWLKHRRGKEGVGHFMAAAMEHLEWKSFQIEEVVGNERVVVALARIECVVKQTGKTLIEECEPHVWHFDATGKVIKFRHAADTNGHVKALTK